MKRIMFSILMILCLLLTGCGPYVSVTPHRKQRQPAQTDVVAAADYLELLAALKETIAAGVEVVTITVAEYPQDQVEHAVQRAVRHARVNDPIGSYAVENIRYELGTRNGIPAVSMSITYLRNRSELLRIRKAFNMDQADGIVSDTLEGYGSGIVMLVQDYKQRDYAQFVQDYAQDHPQKVMETPLVSQTVYGTGKDRVVELIFTYQTSRDSLRRMQSQVKPVFEAAALYVSGDGEQRQKYSQLYAFLMERFEYKLGTSITPSYSLLCHGVGDSRAFATVYAAMCRSAGLECLVVTGTKGGEPRSWNMILVDGQYFHVDLLHESGSYRELVDWQMGSYVWDYSEYPESLGQDMEENTEK